MEIEGTEPYIVGGHTASGYWVDTERETTIHGLYAAGDVAGGCPQKYVTGALVEGEIAAHSIVQKLNEEQVADTAASDEEAVLEIKLPSMMHFSQSRTRHLPLRNSRKPCRKSWTSMQAESEPITSSTKSSLPWRKKNKETADPCKRTCGSRYA